MAIPLLVYCIFLSCMFSSVESQGLLECRICTNALSLDECTKTQLCSHDEQCFMDEILTSSLQVVFNGGCRSTMVCNGGTHVTGKRAVTDHVICSTCCNTTRNLNFSSGECNIHVCGISSSTGSKQTNQCYYCGPWDNATQDAVANPHKCRNIKTCADDEACSVTAVNTRGVITYEFGCKQLLLCQIGTIKALELHGVNTHIDVQHLMETGTVVVGRKRQLNICDVCCGDGLCNDDSCEVVKRRLIGFANANKFNYSTLTLMT